MWKMQEKSYAWVSLETEKLQVVQPSDVALGKQANLSGIFKHGQMEGSSGGEERGISSQGDRMRCRV